MDRSFRRSVPAVADSSRREDRQCKTVNPIAQLAIPTHRISRKGGMTEPQTILLAGGGTGGHLYPGIATALAMKDIWPQAKPLFLCTSREIDRVILQPTGFEFIPQPIVPPVKTIAGLLRFWRGWRETKDLIKQ